MFPSEFHSTPLMNTDGKLSVATTFHTYENLILLCILCIFDALRISEESFVTEEKL